MTAQQWAGHAPLPDQATLVAAATQGFFKSLAAERSLGNTISFKLTTPLQASFPPLPGMLRDFTLASMEFALAALLYSIQYL